MFTLRRHPFSQQTVINRDDCFLAVRDASVFWLSFGFTEPCDLNDKWEEMCGPHLL